MSKKRDEHDVGLKFLQQAFGLSSLHFGLFTEDQPYNLENLRKAQVNYTSTLVSLVPDGVKTVLDVGSGLGDISKVLIDRGYKVEGLSPDAYHGEKYLESCGKDAVFHLSKFEDFRTDTRYDCLLFGESPQYIDKDAYFPKCLELTNPGSCIVLADFFQKHPGDVYPKCFVESDFVARAEKAGFRVDYHRDITKEVLPNLEVARLFLAYGQKLFAFITDTLKRRKRFLWFLANLFYGRRIRRVHQILHENSPKWLDSARFEENMRYAMYRLVRPA